MSGPDPFQKIGVSGAAVNAAATDIEKIMKKHGLMNMQGMLAMHMVNWMALSTHIVMLDPLSPENGRKLITQLLGDLGASAGLIVDRALEIRRAHLAGAPTLSGLGGVERKAPAGPKAGSAALASAPAAESKRKSPTHPIETRKARRASRSKRK